MIVAVTGHRPKFLGNDYSGTGPYSNYIRQELQKIIDKYQPSKMISGMAIGVDMIWAELAIKNKIPLIAAIPFIGQESKWRKSDKIRYCRILENAYESYVISEDKLICGSLKDVFYERDKWMVNNCHKLIAVIHKKKRTGGTYFTTQYAKKQKIPIIYIDPKGWMNE